RTCIVQFALRVAQFYMHESCVKCTPCRVGTRWLVQLMRAVEEGTASERDLELTLDVCDRIIGKCLCVLGDSAAMPVASCVTKFRDEFRAHLEHGGCPFGADSQLAGLLAPVDQHGHTTVPQEAEEGQHATLEFILVNHPLDCPVCDKGGECPLQDLTFRYGPGDTRMSFEKLTFEKPIPISPTISLDRERCILCYRCTRFSEDVSEDGQLVARNRGAMPVITTFED